MFSEIILVKIIGNTVGLINALGVTIDYLIY